MQNDSASTSESANSSRRVSQREAVRLAMRALGDGASNQSLISYVRERYGHDVSKYISQFKNAARKMTAKSGGQHARRVRTPSSPASFPSMPAIKPGATKGLAEDLTTLARLTAKYGVDEVKGMLQVIDTISSRNRS